MQKLHNQFSMSDLLDYEAQLIRDGNESEERLDDRDSKLLDKVKAEPDSPKQPALLRWLHEIRRERRQSWPSTSWDRVIRIATYISIGIGIVSGVSLMQCLLRYNGEAPVNIMPFLGVFVFLQILLLSLYIFRRFFSRLVQKEMESLSVTMLGEYLKRIFERRMRKADPAFSQVFVDRLFQLHRPLFELHAWRLLQLSAITFILAAVLSFLFSLIQHDYGFGWSSTVVGSDLFYGVLRALATPFHWIHDSLLPDRGLVDASRFTRFEKSYTDPTISSAQTGAWWPFLAGCMITYALIPRILIGIITELGIRSQLSSLPFDDFMSSGLWQRLTRPRNGWVAQGTEPAPVLQRAKEVRPERGDAAIILRWRDCPLSDEDLRRFFATEGSSTIKEIINSVGRVEELDGISSAFKNSGAKELIIVCDPWELPGEAMERTRKHLRKNLSDKIRFVFVPLEKTTEGLAVRGDMKAWAYAIGAFRDPYLGLFRSGKEAI